MADSAVVPAVMCVTLRSEKYRLGFRALFFSAANTGGRIVLSAFERLNSWRALERAFSSDRTQWRALLVADQRACFLIFSSATPC